MPNNLPRLVLLALIAATSSRAAEITGTVREASGDTATVVVEGELVPGLGDKAEIFFKFAGGKEEIAVATGTVTGEEAGTVKVKITEATGEVSKDQLARFTSSNPKPRSASLPSAPSSPSTPTTGPTPTPTEAERYFMEGLTKFEAKDFKGALAALTKAIELNPTYAKAYANRASMYYSLRQSARGLADANEAIRLDPHPICYIIRGNIYSDTHQLKRALEDYNEAIRLDPKNADAYYNRGTAYIAMRKYKIAIQDLTRAIELNPTYENAFWNRASAYQAIGKTQLAKLDFARVKELKAQPKPTPAPPERNKEKSP